MRVLLICIGVEAVTGAEAVRLDGEAIGFNAVRNVDVDGDGVGVGAGVGAGVCFPFLFRKNVLMSVLASASSTPCALNVSVLIHDGSC